MNPPQSVTERYVSNLIHYGRNKEFDIDTLVRVPSYHGETVVGWYYKTDIVTATDRETGVGATISQAVRHALTGHGVTFR
jgi:hypothetical protein